MALLLIRVCWQVLRGTLPWLVDHMAVAPEAIYAEAMATAGVMNSIGSSSPNLQPSHRASRLAFASPKSTGQ